MLAQLGANLPRGGHPCAMSQEPHVTRDAAWHREGATRENVTKVPTSPISVPLSLSDFPVAPPASAPRRDGRPTGDGASKVSRPDLT